MTVNDPIFGELRKDEFDWLGKYNILIFGRRKYVELLVDGDDKGSTPEQRELFLKFEQEKQRCIEDIEKSIYNHYCSILKNKRNYYGFDVDKVYPDISTINDLRKLVSLDTILIPEQHSINIGKIGFLFDCAWDPRNGIGVELIDNKVTAVSNQDILL